MNLDIVLADGSVLDVGRWPLPDGLEDGLLNRGQIARAFHVSENTITKWKDLGMPVEEEGSNGQAYSFRLSVCHAWRQARDAGIRAARDEGDRLAAQAAFAFFNSGEEEEPDQGLSTRERRELAELAMREMQAAEQRGDLVRVDRVRRFFEQVFVGVRSALTVLPDWAEGEFGLSPDQVAAFQRRSDEVLVEMRLAIEREAMGQATVASLAELREAASGQ